MTVGKERDRPPVRAPENGSSGSDLPPHALAVDGDITTVPINSLLLGESPRLTRENSEYVHTLAQMDGAFPPILVHRQTMRVIDGTHRLRAAALRQQEHIEVRFFDGDESLIFPIAVEANIRRGLPLSLAERRAAAARIISMHQHWADRVIAAVAGLSPKTVAVIRRRTAMQLHHPTVRLGRDGRLRPVDATAGRRIASELISSQPHASLRQIARAAGISPATARDVRQRMERDGGFAPPTGRATPGDPGRTGSGSASGALAGPFGNATMVERDSAATILRMKRDPSLRFTDMGRELLRWLDLHAVRQGELERFVRSIPPHWVNALAGLAKECAGQWTEFARQLEERDSSSSVMQAAGRQLCN